MALRNVDDLLIKDNQERLQGVTPGSTEPYESKPDQENEKPDAIESEPAREQSESVDLQEEVKQEPEDKEEKPIAAEAKESDSKEETNKDEYGNDVAPQQSRMYSEEEVQSMIRDRLSRGKYAQQQPQPQYSQQQVQQAQREGFEHDPSSSESWEVQLEQFIETTIAKREQKQQSEIHHQREQQIQAEFEGRFTSGMAKYKDFQNVVAGKPITDSMMLATRGMSDPAAFIYSAAKNHGKELERIANIPDPYQQGMEIGKLEERMRKARATTAAPKPITKTVGDSIAKQAPAKKSIDDKIFAHAKSKFRR